MTFKKTIIFFELFFLIQVTLYAQSKSDTLEVDLKSIEVNANYQKLYSELGRIVTVIDKETISTLPVGSIDELLESAAGIDIRQRGTGNTQADISMRGGTFDQVLVLLNGVNITDPQTGHYNLDIPLNLSDIKKIEILQGSAARVLGPNAFSGAINIVTESNDKSTLNLEQSGGSFNTYNQSVSGNLAGKKTNTFASISHNSSDGYIKNTDYNISNAFLHSVLHTSKLGKYDLQLASLKKAFGANSFYSLKYPNQYENTQTLFANLNWAINLKKLNVKVQGYWRQHYDRYKLDFNNSATWNYHLTDVSGFKSTASYFSRIGKSTVGFELRNEHILSNKLGQKRDSLLNPFDKNVYFTKEDNRLLTNIFIDQSVNFNKFYISLGASASHSSDFKWNSFGGIDIGYHINDDIRFYSSLNTALRLPTFTDLYYQNAIQVANPNLKPEHSQTLEIGSKFKKNNFDIEATIYRRWGQNIIDWVKLPASSVWESKNLTNVNAMGLDFSSQYFFKKSFIKSISATYSYLQMDKTANEFDSKYALDYLKQKITLNINHSIWKNLSVTWKAAYYDRSGTYDANRIIGAPTQITNYSPYFMLDSRILFTQKKYNLYLDLNNILNASNIDFGGLEQAGRNILLGIRIKLS